MKNSVRSSFTRFFNRFTATKDRPLFFQLLVIMLFITACVLVVSRVLWLLQNKAI
jgi:hypothetical protein